MNQRTVTVDLYPGKVATQVLSEDWDRAEDLIRLYRRRSKGKRALTERQALVWAGKLSGELKRLCLTPEAMLSCALRGVDGGGGWVLSDYDVSRVGEQVRLFNRTVLTMEAVGMDAVPLGFRGEVRMTQVTPSHYRLVFTAVDVAEVLPTIKSFPIKLVVNDEHHARLQVLSGGKRWYWLVGDRIELRTAETFDKLFPTGTCTIDGREDLVVPMTWRRGVLPLDVVGGRLHFRYKTGQWGMSVHYQVLEEE